MGFRRKAIAGAVAIGLLGTVPAAAGTDPFRTAVHGLVDAGFPGAVAYQRTGTGHRAFAEGVADLATGRAALPGDRFRVASNTKAFVAAIVFQLAESGRLSLQDSVRRWLPGVVGGPGYDASKITVERLLNHTSGVHDPRDPEFFAPYLDEHRRGYVYTPDEVIRRSLVDPPATGPEYSNTGYLLLGKIIERVTHHTAESEIRHRLIGPLGLTRTTFPRYDPFIHGRHLHGYDMKNEDMTVFSPSYDWTAGAVISTVDDLAKFQRALLGGKLVGADSLARMKQVVLEEGPIGYGLGLERLTAPCPGGRQVVAWGGTGAGPGYYSMAFTTDDGSRQAVLGLSKYDLRADVTKVGKVAPAPPAPAMLAALCG
ncbi:serine hydrolase domain-containing protein [Amycolatopsis minnesotensis]|uniref:Serine hydrolase domain-containing protein n=1 Tax=Amycolatopsis minnesotensis TaxID=337894 RepID=A0ABP5CQL0_9PSEU